MQLGSFQTNTVKPIQLAATCRASGHSGHANGSGDGGPCPLTLSEHDAAPEKGKP